jgi:hypothetical protein
MSSAWRHGRWQVIGGLLVAAAAAVGFIYLIRDNPAEVARVSLTIGSVLLPLAAGLLIGGAAVKLRSRRHELVASYSASVIVKEASLAFLLWFLGHNLAWAAALLLLVSLLLWLLGPQLLVLAISVGAVAAAAFVLGGLVSPAPVRMLGLCWQIPEPISGPGPLAYAGAAVAFGPRLQAVARSDLARAAASGGRPLWKRMQDAFDLDRVAHDCPRITLRQPLRQAMLHEVQVRSRTLGLIALLGFLLALLPLSFGGAAMPGIGGGTPFVSAQEDVSELEEQSEEHGDSRADDEDVEPDNSRLYDESRVEPGGDPGKGDQGSEARSYGETGDDSSLPGDSTGSDPHGETSLGEPSGAEPGDSSDYQDGNRGSGTDSHTGSEGTGSAATSKPHDPEDCPDPFRCQKPGCVAARSGSGGQGTGQQGSGGSSGSQSSGGAAQQGGTGSGGSQSGGSGGAAQQGGTGSGGSQSGGSGGAAQQGGSGSQSGGSGGTAQQGGSGGSGGAAQQGSAGAGASGAGSSSSVQGSGGAGAGAGAGSGQGSGGGAGAAGGCGGQGSGSGSGVSGGGGGQGSGGGGDKDPFGAPGRGGGGGGSGGGGSGAGGSGAGQATSAAAGTGGGGTGRQSGSGGDGGSGGGGGGSGWGSSSAFGQSGTGTGPLTFPAPSEMISVDLPTIAGRHVPLIPGVPEEGGEQSRSGADSSSETLPLPPEHGDGQEPQIPGQPRQQLPAWIASLLQPSGSGQ